jgi:mevalonate kinase
LVSQLKGGRTENLDFDDDKCLMGIVTGAGYGDNVATLITPEIMQWTTEKLQNNLHLSGRALPGGR